MMVAPPRTLPSSSSASNTTTAYAISLLSEYMHSLDSLPLELSRVFADLHELEAVVTSPTASVAGKINRLADMIQGSPGALKQERLWLLSEIAEEAGRLKLGGEDKIRIVSHAADMLRGQASHMRALMEMLPGLQPSLLRRGTTYPHVSTRSYMPAGGMETGRRRRGGYGSLLTGSVDSPSKKKRAPREDGDVEGGGANGRSPRKDRAGEGAPRSRNNARSRKHDRAASPSESVLSANSHMPSHHTAQYQFSTDTQPRHAQGAPSSRASNPGPAGSSGTAKRARPSNLSVSTPPGSGGIYERGSGSGAHTSSNAVAGGGAGSNGSARRDAFHTPVPAPSAHTSLLYNGGEDPIECFKRAAIEAVGAVVTGRPPILSTAPGGGGGVGVPGMNAPEWPIPGQLEGPGMPVARPRTPLMFAPVHAGSLSGGATPGGGAAAADAGAMGDLEGEGDDDVDNRRYCICDGVSYGEMIACDDLSCEKEWFHLGCLNLTVTPVGSWYCDACKAKRNAKKSGRGGKRKTASHQRAGGKAVGGGGGA